LTPLRVLIVSWRDLDHPFAGGSEVLIARLAEGLGERGHDVTLLASGARTPTGQYRTVDAGGRLTQYLTDPLRARRLGRFDVVVDVCNGVPFFAPLWSRAPTVALVNHIHFGMWREWFSPWVSLVGSTIETKVMPSLYRSRSVVAVSDSTARALVSLGMPAANITVVHNGVDVADIGERTVRRADEPTFLAVGRLVPHKRFDLLLRAWARVQPITGGRLLLAGEGPLRDELAADLPPSTELLGRVTDEERRSLMEAAWFLVQPSRLEGWGLVVMEAAAASTPTLGFWAPGTSDAVVHGESGILVHTEAELVEEWLRLAQDPLARQMLSKGAAERARHFSWERSITDFEAVLRRAAAGATPAGSPDRMRSIDSSHATESPLAIGAPGREPMARRAFRGVRRSLGDNPAFLPVVLRASRSGPRGRITPETQLVVEGFPASGSTFAHFAVLHADPRASVTSPIHTPSQLKRAVRRGKPALLIVRAPEDAVASLAIAAPQIAVTSHLFDYVHYHSELIPLLAHVVAATFDEVMTDFDQVLDAVNYRFGLQLARFDHTPQHAAEVFAEVSCDHDRQLKRDHPDGPTPAEDRREVKDLLRAELRRVEHATLYQEAVTVFSAVAAQSVTAPR